MKIESLNNNVFRELRRLGADIVGNKVRLYRGGDVPKSVLRKLRYNDFLSTVKNGTDAGGNAGASSYGRNVVELLVPVKDVKVRNGEVLYVGASDSITRGRKYPLEIYKAYCDVYGSNFTFQEIDEADNVAFIAPQGLVGGEEEFEELMRRHEN